MNESERQDLIRKNKEKRREQLAFARGLAAKIRDEPEEKDYTSGPLTAFNTSGGGKRIVRSGKEMS